MSDSQVPPPRWWALPLPPWWIYLLGLLADVGTACWRTVSTAGDKADLFFSSLLWPGLVIAAVVMVVAWLGWSLDLG